MGIMEKKMETTTMGYTGIVGMILTWNLTRGRTASSKRLAVGKRYLTA